MKHNMPISLLITSGNGPAECNQAIAGVLQHMLDEAETIGLELDVNTTPSKHGAKSAVIIVHGLGNDAFAKRWCGTIRWRAKSTLRPNHKRANWFVGVFQLTQNVTVKVEVNPSDVMFESFRAGGPGGQHQNTTDSAVRATHRPSGLTAVAREMRSQHRNKALALERLQTLMNAQVTADHQAQKTNQNQLHNSLERGNPVRCFKGTSFREERCG
ncbi:peptide chain release factor H [Parasulfitobacter algicola]|uniref:Peptide chain release factor H n=1 Tax=Parasulfitobacter algicola TaxID=2614809 RepID=A0ABX2ILJ3_9RHOB|nr:peptide chain release factor H [Sulfitobacter algicola]NSX53746.1 peptide chain release factor H [Sulfitobacter algicola]